MPDFDQAIEQYQDARERMTKMQEERAKLVERQDEITAKLAELDGLITQQTVALDGARGRVRDALATPPGPPT